MVKVTDDSCDILLNELMNINEQKHLQFKMLTDLKSLETLPVDDRWTRFYAEGNNIISSKHNENQDYCSTRKEILRLDWWFYPSFSFNLPTDVDQ
jgi:hypothetical protein